MLSQHKSPAKGGAFAVNKHSTVMIVELRFSALRRLRVCHRHNYTLSMAGCAGNSLRFGKHLTVLKFLHKQYKHDVDYPYRFFA